LKGKLKGKFNIFSSYYLSPPFLLSFLLYKISIITFNVLLFIFIKYVCVFILSMIIEKCCIDCLRFRPMYHNAHRCYDCAMERRKKLDRLRFKNRKKGGGAKI
jgi:hypothetical protein